MLRKDRNDDCMVAMGWQRKLRLIFMYCSRKSSERSCRSNTFEDFVTYNLDPKVNRANKGRGDFASSEHETNTDIDIKRRTLRLIFRYCSEIQ